MHKGSVHTTLDGSPLWFPNCTCGWKGTTTGDQDAAWREALAHSDPEWREEIKDMIPFLDGTLPRDLPQDPAANS